MSENEAGPASRHLWLILGLALLVRTLVWLPGGANPERFYTPDSFGYMELAGDLEAGYLDPQSHTFTLGLIRTPGYPFFLAAFLRLFQGSVRAVMAVQIGMSLVTVWLTYILACRLIGRRTAVAGSLLLALDPTSILFSCLIQPETLFTALMVAGTLCWLLALLGGRWRLAVGAGLLIGGAALTRPIGLFLALYLAAAVCMTRDIRPRTRLLICFLLASMLPIGPNSKPSVASVTPS